MAKRPPSKAPDDAELVDAPDLGGPDTVAAEASPDTAPAVESTGWAPVSTPDVEPVAMEEPPRFGPDPEETPVQRDDTPPLDATDAVQPPPPPDPVAPPAAPVAASQDQRRGGGFVSTALGGVVAAAAGYALAIFVPFPGMGVTDAPAYATQAEVQVLTGRLDRLESIPAVDPTLAGRVSELEARPVQDAAPAQDLSPVTDALAALEQRLDTMDARGLDGAVRAPSADLAPAVQSLRAEVDALQADVAAMKDSGASANAGLEALTAQTETRLAEAEALAATLRQEAEATARRAVAAAALSRVQAAIDSGAPFAGALVDLQDISVPPDLATLAQTGVPSRAVLEDAYPPAARAALEVSLRATMGEGWSDRIATFLQSTTGARSLTPREGGDPDAVLSRAEAAVKAGDLAQALTELQGLPPEGQAQMAAWSELAQKRLDAVSAVSALSAAVEG